jgi:hypothetical protein
MLALAVTACSIPAGPLNGRATDEWTHRYPLTPTGVVRIENTSGFVDIQAADSLGDGINEAVEVRAERIARAITDAAARDLLPHISIKEDIKPDAVSIETEKMAGVMLGATIEVRYHVRAPKNATIHVSSANGRVTLTGFSGAVLAVATNGAITGKDLGGAVDAETTNGVINVDMAAVGGGKIKARTTNGSLTLSVPDAAKADLKASVTNGLISVMAANFEASEQSRRRVEGRLNGGGSAIELSTTNGLIRFATRSRRDSQPEPRQERERRQR